MGIFAMPRRDIIVLSIFAVVVFGMPFWLQPLGAAYPALMQKLAISAVFAIGFNILFGLTGYLSFGPTMPVPATSTVTFAAGSTRSNNTILPLASDGSGRLHARAFVADGGAVHVVVDVTGFFR